MKTPAEYGLAWYGGKARHEKCAPIGELRSYIDLAGGVTRFYCTACEDEVAALSPGETKDWSKLDRRRFLDLDPADTVLRTAAYELRRWRERESARPSVAVGDMRRSLSGGFGANTYIVPADKTQPWEHGSCGTPLRRWVIPVNVLSNGETRVLCPKCKVEVGRYTKSYLEDLARSGGRAQAQQIEQLNEASFDLIQAVLAKSKYGMFDPRGPMPKPAQEWAEREYDRLMRNGGDAYLKPPPAPRRQSHKAPRQSAKTPATAQTAPVTRPVVRRRRSALDEADAAYDSATPEGRSPRPW